VVRSPTSAETPSGNGASPQGALRQAAITAGSVGTHGSGLAGVEDLVDPVLELPGDEVEVRGALLSGNCWGITGVTMGAVRLGCAVNVEALAEKLPHPVTPASSAQATATAPRRR